MLSKSEFVEYVLGLRTAPAATTTSAASASALPGDFDDFDDAPATVAAADPSDFARGLLERCFGDAPERPVGDILVPRDEADQRRLDAEYAPGAHYWRKTEGRPFHVVLVRLRRSGTDLVDASPKRSIRDLALLEDELHRRVQDGLAWFERGGPRRTADMPQGSQAETLYVVAATDNRTNGKARQILCFGTHAAETKALEAFFLREEARDWEPHLDRSPLAVDHLEAFFRRHLQPLGEGIRWQDSFITGAERKRARALMDECAIPLPNETKLQEAVRNLLDEIAHSFGIKRKAYSTSTGTVRMRLPVHALPDNHTIALNVKEPRASGFKNPFKGLRVSDDEGRLLGYVVYVLTDKKKLESLQDQLVRFNHFHNVLVVYPEQGGASIQLWTGKERLQGRLRGGARLSRFDGEGGVVELLSRFFVVSRSTIRRADHLATELGHRAQHLRRLALDELQREKRAGGGKLLKILDAFNRTLTKTDESGFADTYAQTITYGLLAARWMSRDVSRRFTRTNASDQLPRTSPFLHDLFDHLIDLPFDANLTWLLDDMVGLLARTDVHEVFSEEADPVIHFYETFLKEYAPELVSLRGVYYTPDDAVRFIVNGVDALVAVNADTPGGLADTSRWTQGEHAGQYKVQVLDPACGTGTFLKHVLIRVRDRFVASQPSGTSPEATRQLWAAYVRENLAERLFGFEIMVAPYVICHLQLSMVLVSTGLRAEELPSLRIYLTNSLQDPGTAQPTLPGQEYLTDEGRAAQAVKCGAAISVIVGNPPYSSSVYEDPWILGLMETYKRDLNEKKMDLNREEWKFFRFAHDRLARMPAGVLGFVINRSYLDGVTLRRMRQELGQDFPHRLVVDLHADVKGRTVESEHGRDENIFEIEQGVCVSLLARYDSAPSHHLYRSLPGPAEYKLNWLRTTDLRDAEHESEPCTPGKPYYLWVKGAGQDALAAYDSWPQLSEVFGTYSSGIQTGKDGLAIDFERKTLLATLRRFVSIPPAEARAEFDLGLDSAGWSVAAAQDDLKESPITASGVTTILYRPFDFRYTYYTGKSAGFLKRPRREVMQHFVDRENLGIIANRQVVSKAVTHFGATRVPNCHGTFYLGNKGQDYLFPLYRYDEAATPIELRAGAKGKQRRSNLDPGAVAKLANATGLQALPVDRGDLESTFGPDDFLAYVFAVFHSPVYRTRYDERLHIDFPRVPLSPSAELFRELVPLGLTLLAAHTLADDVQPAPDVQYAGPLPQKVEKLLARTKPIPLEGGAPRLSLGKKAWLSGITDEDWFFEIGGYQPVHKWLEARKKAARLLGPEDFVTLRRIVTALRTIRGTMGCIHEVLERHGGWPGAFETETP